MEVGQLRFVESRWSTHSPWKLFQVRGLHGIEILSSDYDKLCDTQFEIIRTWCLDQFGPVNIERWLATREGFYFSSDTDATAFKIRWC